MIMAWLRIEHQSKHTHALSPDSAYTWTQIRNANQIANVCFSFSCSSVFLFLHTIRFTRSTLDRHKAECTFRELSSARKAGQLLLRIRDWRWSTNFLYLENQEIICTSFRQIHFAMNPFNPEMAAWVPVSAAVAQAHHATFIRPGTLYKAGHDTMRPVTCKFLRKDQAQKQRYGRGRVFC